MDYLNWANEYLDTVEKINGVIKKLKVKIKNDKSSSSKNGLIKKRIAYWQSIRRECLKTANILNARAVKH
ncbi:MAG: hypothetical protein IJT85_03430 [Ruminococcus sp.]|nr:hypothetical protein [Ruminococcus sp.]